VQSASSYPVIPAGSAGIQRHGWQKQWGFESSGRTIMPFEIGSLWIPDWSKMTTVGNTMIDGGTGSFSQQQQQIIRRPSGFL